MKRRSLAPLALLPEGALTILKEVGRHLLRRPIVGIAAVAWDEAGRVVLIRRGDTGTWALPGGTLEWGETFAEALPRELAEEAGVDLVPGSVELLGVFSSPDRDPRFHAVTVVVTCKVAGAPRGAKNPLEIREVGAFPPEARPGPLAMGMDDYITLAQRRGPPVLE